ncbi:MAG: VanZ family protein [Nocardioides sp.]|uniref:VanZ family protein n=1 Tax=Nocardioides sp. TaxID=35761 RepID=UPI0039E45DCD
MFRVFGGDLLEVVILGLPAAVVIVGVRWLMLRTNRPQRQALLDAVLEAGIVLNVGAVASITLMPEPYTEVQKRVVWEPWTSDLAYGPERVQVIGNLILLAPLVLFLLLRLRPSRRLAVGVTLSVALPLAIELGQATIIAGRVASIEDLILGAAGGLLGTGAAAALAPRLERWATPQAVPDDYSYGTVSR